MPSIYEELTMNTTTEYTPDLKDYETPKVDNYITLR